MGSLRIFTYLCLAAAASGAERPQVLIDLANRAHSVPAEFAADALLRIAASSPAANLAWKRELIEDAFRIAVGAQQPYARRAWLTSHGGLAEKAFAQGLDACTLQCRAVEAMLALDPRKAREMFEQIPSPAIPRLSCEDALVYDVSAFYATLGDVAQQGFSPKEVALQEPLHLLERYVPALTSPVQAGPIATMLTGAPVPPAQLEGLIDAFASSLKQLSGDGRAFSATISGQSDAAAIEALASAGGRHRINSLPVLDAWRSYLVRHLGGSVCGDVSGVGASGLSVAINAAGSTDAAYSGPVGAVRYFNENMRTGALAAISDQEVQPANLDSVARVIGPCESVECRQFNSQFGGLVLGASGMAYTEEEKAGPEWAGKLKEFMEAVNGWKSADDPAEYFLWKGHFYSNLFHVLPNGANRDIVLSAFLSWLEQNDYQRDHRVEWFYSVNALIISAFADPLAMKTTMRELRSSGDPVISFYAELERVLPRPFEHTVSLL
jgi:hypothetical protein